MNKCNNNDSWINKSWRPMMGFLYLIICAFDFVIAPTIFIFLQSSSNNITQWEPLTMKAGGLFHVAMGAIVGVAAWSRGMEKIKNSEFFNRSKDSIPEDDVSRFPEKEINVTKDMIDEIETEEFDDLSSPIDETPKKRIRKGINKTK